MTNLHEPTDEFRFTTEDGRTGRAVRQPGYVIGGNYVNPCWQVFMDPDTAPGDMEATRTRR